MAALDFRRAALNIARAFEADAGQTFNVLSRCWGGGSAVGSARGSLLPTPEEYRRYAKLCTDLAGATEDKAECSMLLQIAQSFRRLANHKTKRERRQEATGLTDPQRRKSKPRRSFNWYRSRFAKSRDPGSPTARPQT